MSNFFSLKRFALLIRNDLFLYRSTIITTAITITCLLFLYNLISPRNMMTINYHPTAFLWLLFIGGIWISSRAFKTIHNKQSNYFTLTLPCSTFEKFLSRLLLTSIIYALAVLAFYSLFYWILGGLFLLFYHKSAFIATPILPETWRMIWMYMVAQSMFLLGSIYFSRLALLKTVLMMSVIGIFFSIIILILSKIFLFNLLINNIIWLPHFGSTSFESVEIIGILLWIVVAPFCWTITYFRLKEIEG